MGWSNVQCSAVVEVTAGARCSVVSRSSSSSVVKCSVVEGGARIRTPVKSCGK